MIKNTIRTNACITIKTHKTLSSLDRLYSIAKEMRISQPHPNGELLELKGA